MTKEIKKTYVWGNDKLECWTRDEGNSEREDAMYVSYNGRTFKILKTCEVSGKTYPLTLVLDCDNVSTFSGMPNTVAGMIWGFFYGNYGNVWDMYEVLKVIKDYLEKSN